MTNPGQAHRPSHIASLMPTGKKPSGCASRPEVAEVVTVTVTGVGVEPLSVTELGAEQLDPGGAPLQVSDTVCENPPAGATAIV
jgi:hypothetical protein